MIQFLDIHSHNPSQAIDTLILRNWRWSTDQSRPEGYYSVGLHPWDIKDDHFPDREAFMDALLNENCLALGESGLDRMAESSLSDQEHLFFLQCGMAEQAKKPVIIHCVKAFDRLLKIRKEFQPEVPWIVHGFNKNIHLAEQLLEEGFYLSLGYAVLRYPHIKEMLSDLPLDRLFFETDDVETLSVRGVYREVSDICGLSIDLLQEQIRRNFNAVFGYELTTLAGKN